MRRLALALAIAAAGSAAHAGTLTLNYLGQTVVPTGTLFDGTTLGSPTGDEFGGLSGLDYNAATGRFTVISDNRGERGNPRFYDMTLSYGLGGFTGITVHSQTKMLRPDGTPFPASPTPRQVDPETIRIAPNGNLFISSEGNFNTDPTRLFQPFVRELTTAGVHVRDFAVPTQFNYVDSATAGGRSNLLFEASAVSKDGKTLFVGAENAIVQDGPIASLTLGSPSRITAYDIATGLPTAQYVYEVAPIPKATPLPPGPSTFNDNGLVELLAISDTQLLAMERSFASAVGNTIKIFLIDLAGASDVSGIPSLASASYTPVSKTLILDLETIGAPLDNIEGMSWGPTLSNGRNSLVLVADNNFSTDQFTQFLAFEVEGIPAPAGLSILAVAVPALLAMRRRKSA
ncbi:MAG: esterase-like activity of phytase family protein [Alphaproteobacteria bacterium]|nr:esterase-like activity of phytase family protein [Alphaproteobacteria bacterium]